VALGQGAPPAEITLPRRIANDPRDRFWNVTEEELSVAMRRPMYSLLAEFARTTTSFAVSVRPVTWSRSACQDPRSWRIRRPPAYAAR
jgi:hypothetical protein